MEVVKAGATMEPLREYGVINMYDMCAHEPARVFACVLASVRECVLLMPYLL